MDMLVRQTHNFGAPREHEYRPLKGLGTRCTLEPLVWRWSHWSGRLVGVGAIGAVD